MVDHRTFLCRFIVCKDRLSLSFLSNTVSPQGLVTISISVLQQRLPNNKLYVLNRITRQYKRRYLQSSLPPVLHSLVGPSLRPFCSQRNQSQMKPPLDIGHVIVYALPRVRLVHVHLGSHDAARRLVCARRGACACLTPRVCLQTTVRTPRFVTSYITKQTFYTPQQLKCLLQNNLVATLDTGYKF